MKMTHEQQMRLNNVTKADLEWRTAKVEMAAIAKRYAEEKIAHISYERDRAVRLAIECGVPKRALAQRHQGLHTTDPGTVSKALERTEGVAGVVTAEETDPLGKRYSLNRGALVVTLTPDELTEAMRAVNYEADTAPASAEFTLEHNARGPRLKALSPETLENYERNPAVYWTYEREAEALAWYAEHTENEGEVAA